MEEGRFVRGKDWLRIDLVQQAASGKLTASQVARGLGVTVRQVRRLIATLRKKGSEGLLHGNRGKVSAARLPQTTREEVIRLLKTEYADYNTAHARDDLEEFHAIKLSYSALYRLRREAGLVSPRRHRVATHRTRRERAAQEGLLLQADGSSHAWLEERGPHLTLIAYIDDATGQVAGATFRQQEDAVGYLQVLQAISTRRGVPQSLYTDRHTIFGLSPEVTIAQKLRGEAPTSHVQRVLEDLGIVRIPAHSPQAKGRVERLFGTFQDRLTRELRREGASTLAEANQVLAKYLPRYNARFAHQAQDPSSAYRTWPVGLQSEKVFTFRYERTVANDNTIAFGGLHLPIPPAPRRRHYARARVSLLMRLDGQLDVYYKEKRIASFPHSSDVPVRVDHFVPAVPLEYAPTKPTPAPQAEPPAVMPEPTKREVQRPAADHPWNRSPIGRRARHKDKVTESLVIQGDIVTG